MTTRLFDVTIRASAKRLPVILQTLDGEAELVGVRPCDDGVNGRPRRRRRPVSHADADRPDDPRRGDQIAFDFLKTSGGQVTTEQLQAEFGRLGRSPKSVSPAMSLLKKQRKIVSPGKGRYALAAKGGK